MSVFVGYPKIGQFRNVVQGILRHEQFVGLDEDGEAIYDRTKVMPTLSFKGTVKLHGTNAGFGLHQGEVWCQSRTGVVTPTKDNAGFAAAFSGEKSLAVVRKILTNIKTQHNVADDKIIVMFGEWCGGSVQKGVALNQLDKRFVLFGIRVVGAERNDDGNYTYDKWLPIDGIRAHESNIYNIKDYPGYQVVIDFNNPGDVANTLATLTERVEAECPFGKAFGVTGVGEGIVWTLFHDGARYAFKTKGKKHSATKVKSVAAVDVEKVANVKEFVEMTVTENRLHQALEQVFKDEDPTIKGTGKFLKWLTNDIVTEEIDTLSENGLCAKDVNGAISKKGREWFFAHLDKLVLG